MKCLMSVNRSGKLQNGPVPAPGQSGIIPADPSADSLDLYAIMLTAGGELVSADPVPADIEGVRFGDPLIKDAVVYGMLCTSVADQQLGGDDPGSGPTRDVFHGMVRCGKWRYISMVSGVSESFMSNGVRMVTMDFALGIDILFAPASFPPRATYMVHANVKYFDYRDLFTHDLVLYPAIDLTAMGDASATRQWTCSLSEAPTTTPACSSISYSDGPDASTSWFSVVLPAGPLQPDPLTTNIIMTATGIYPKAEGSAKYNGNTSIMQPIAIEFPTKVFYWLCVGRHASGAAGVYLAKMGNPIKILAYTANVCGLVVGPSIVG